MNSIASESLESSRGRWLLVGAALAALLVAALVILVVHAGPAGEAQDDIRPVDNGM